MKKEESKVIAQKFQKIPNGTLALKHCRTGGTGTTLFGEQFRAVTAGKGVMEAYETTQYFSQQTELIKEIHQQLTEHLDQRFTIAELSKQYLINTSTLKEIFKAVYGQPIATYMKEFRVRQAMKLLRETNDTIADIASQVGYQTQGKFSSAFQSIVKMSPREYRKLQGIAPSDFFSKTL